MTTSSQVLLTFNEAAARLGMGRTLLRSHIETGNIRYVSVGYGTKRRRIMFTHRDLDEFIEDRSRRELAPCPSSSPPGPSTPDRSSVVPFSSIKKASKPERAGR